VQDQPEELVTAMSRAAGGSSWAGVEEEGPPLLGRLLRRCGEARLRVTGTSMLPAIRPGDELLIRRVDITSVLKDDVILFRVGQRLFVHRVVVAGPGGEDRVLVTRGDLHAHDDPPVGAADVLGRVEGQLRKGRAVRRGWKARRGNRGTAAGRWFAYLCTMRRCAQVIRSRSARILERVRLLDRAAKPGGRSADHSMKIRERQRSRGPAWIH
jgi:hypothetical protein